MKARQAIIDHSGPEQASRFIFKVKKMKGPHVWTCKPWYPKRSNQKNAFVWAAIVSAFQVYNEEQGDYYTDDEAFLILKRETLPPGPTYASRKDGELIQLPARSSELNEAEFSEFIEKCIAY